MDHADSGYDPASRKSAVAEEVFQILKEICMEKEIPFRYKCVIENCQVDHSIICCKLNSDSESARGSPEETPMNIPLTPNESEISPKLQNKMMEDFRAEDCNLIKETSEMLYVQTLCTYKLFSTNPIMTHEHVNWETMLANHSEPKFWVEENPESAEWQKFLELASSSNRSFTYQDIHEQGQFPGLVIANSGSMPCSGNVSLRSTSCNTSTRSFAFPTIASEWNFSPVRMVKADRKGLRRLYRLKHWKIFSLCCKF